MTTIGIEPGETAWHKVVIRMESEVIRGYLPVHIYGTVERMSHEVSEHPPKSLLIRREGSEELEKLNVENAKAIFHVKSLEGDQRHRDLRFDARVPIIHGVWVRLLFEDGEVIEGITQNTIHFIVNPGFLLYPSDPDCNNHVAYIWKRHLKDLTILGLRTPHSTKDNQAAPFVHLCGQSTH